MEKKLGKIIMGFFVIMLGLTLLSRAAASVMVPKARTATAQEGALSYKINGTGIIKENAKKYIELISGYKVGELSIKEGQVIEKGEVLFHYDINQLEEKKTVLSKELERLQLQYEKAELGRVDETALTEAERKTEEAKDTIGLAKENEMRALDDKNNAQKTVETTKHKLLLTKQEEYEKAVSEYEELLSEGENILLTAQRKVEDANKELESLRKPRQKVQDALAGYKAALENSNANLVSNTHFSIFDIYYGGSYQEHLLAVEDKTKELTRAQEDLQDIMMEWVYNTDSASIEKQEKSARRNISDLQKDLDILIEKDVELEKAIDVYKQSILKTKNWNIADAENLLFNIIYDKLKIDEDKISIAETGVTRAEEDRERLIAEWDKKESEALVKRDKLYNEMIAMEENQYEGQEELTNSEKALLAADRELTDRINAVQKADRELEAAKIDQNKSKNNLIKSNQAVELELSSLRIDIKDKQTEIDTVQKLITEKGRVKSPVSGVVLTSELEQGAVLSGRERLVISTGEYELEMKATKDELKNFAAGDEISIKAAAGNNRITVNIEHIDLPDQDGNISFTALLPADSSYRVGGGLEFELQKNSQNYISCIPIQAIRQDTSSKFILIIKESDGILGRIQTAFRLDVTIVAQDAKSVAIEAPLSAEEDIIISSSKNISEGDRVRVVETE
jgi:multidrug efflux pump subunit AcrA (membrane-fusion protein)